jgi:NhaP-type Na+/H+ or K+/H+ antiporter
MAVSFRLVYEGNAAKIAYTVVLASVVLNDLIAPRLLRGLLVDEGELQRELKAPESQTTVEVAAG